MQGSGCARTSSSNDLWSFQKFRCEVTQQVDDLQRHYTATLHHLRAENDKLKEQLKSAHSPQSFSIPLLSQPPVAVSSHKISCSPWTPRSPKMYGDLLSTPRFEAPAAPEPQPCPNELDKELPLSSVEGEEPHAAVLRWEQLYTGLRQQADRPRQNVLTHGQELRPIWTTGKGIERVKKSRSKRISVGIYAPASDSTCKTMDRTGFLAAADSTVMDRMGALKVNNSRLQPLVRHPNSTWTLIQSVLSGMIIAMDIVIFPFAFAFGTDLDADGLAIINLCTTIFWTVDIPISFFQGYHTLGVTEMRPHKVALAYVSHWFVPDIAIVVIDWTYLYLSKAYDAVSAGESGILRLGKAIKIVRIMRTARTLRLLKTAKILHNILDHMAPQEWLLMITRLFGLILVVLLVCHYIACLWYIVGWNISRKYFGLLTWIEVQGIQDESPFTIYAFSLHWALTQFTPATNNIAPANAYERAFAIIVVVFAMVMFSNFISSLTNMTAQLRRLHSARANEESQIRNFLSNKHVTLELGRRIWHFYRKHYKLRHKVASTSDIAFFASLPMSLRKQLLSQIYLPTFIAQPVFASAQNLDRNTMMWLCIAGMEEEVVHVGQELFMEEQVATHMIAMLAGKLLYECDDFYVSPVEVEVPVLISEAALWSKWAHCGRLSGAFSAHCEVLMISIAQIEACIAKHATEVLMRFLRKYACQFTQAQSDGFERVWQSVAEADGLSSGGMTSEVGTAAFASSELITDIARAEIVDRIVQRAHKGQDVTVKNMPGCDSKSTKRSSPWGGNNNTIMGQQDDLASITNTAIGFMRFLADKARVAGETQVIERFTSKSRNSELD